MLEAIASNILVLALVGIICKLFYNRLNRLEDKVDKLLTKNGIIYRVGGKKERKVKNGASS